MTGSDHRSLFESLAPAGHYLAVRIGFAFPVYVENSLPKQWVERYTQRGLMLDDPVMHWLYQNTGASRWSAIRIEDPRGVLTQARMFGLKFGLAICCNDKEQAGLRSFGSFARGDREFEDQEIELLSAAVLEVHDSMAPPKNLTRAELEALRHVKNGLLMKEIAELLKVSEGAVKQRLRNAKSKLKAKTSTHAATMATSFGLI